MVTLSELETLPGLSIGLEILAVKLFLHIEQQIPISSAKSAGLCPIEATRAAKNAEVGARLPPQ